jgi:hypothetical protein
MMKGGSRWWCRVVGQLSSTRKRLTPSACLSLSSPVEDEKVRGPKGYWAREEGIGLGPEERRRRLGLQGEGNGPERERGRREARTRIRLGFYKTFFFSPLFQNWFL